MHYRNHGEARNQTSSVIEGIELQHADEQKIAALLREWDLHFDELQNTSDRETALTILDALILEINEKLREIKSTKNKALIKSAESILVKAKNYREKRKGHKTKLVEKFGKVAGMLGLIAAGYGAFTEYSEKIDNKEKIEKLTNGIDNREIPKTPDSLMIATDEQINPVHNKTTKDMYVWFSESVWEVDHEAVINPKHPNHEFSLDKKQKKDIPKLTSDPQKDMLLLYLCYGPQIDNQIFDKFTETTEEFLAARTNRSLEQMQFIRKVIRYDSAENTREYPGFFAPAASLGGISEVFPVTNQIVFPNENPDWYRTQLQQMVAFLDKIYEHKIKKLDKEKQDQAIQIIKKYITAELYTRAQVKRLEIGLNKGSKNMVERSDASPDKKTALEDMFATMEGRSKALTEVYDFLKENDLADSFEAGMADQLARQITILEAMEKILRNYQQGNLRIEEDTFLKTMEDMDGKYLKAKKAYEDFKAASR